MMRHAIVLQIACRSARFYHAGATFITRRARRASLFACFRTSITPFEIFCANTTRLLPRTRHDACLCSDASVIDLSVLRTVKSFLFFWRCWLFFSSLSFRFSPAFFAARL